MNKLMCRFDAAIKNKIKNKNKNKKDSEPNFRHGLPSGHPAEKNDIDVTVKTNTPVGSIGIFNFEKHKIMLDRDLAKLFAGY